MSGTYYHKLEKDAIVYYPKHYPSEKPTIGVSTVHDTYSRLFIAYFKNNKLKLQRVIQRRKSNPPITIKDLPKNKPKDREGIKLYYGRIFMIDTILEHQEYLIGENSGIPLKDIEKNIRPIIKRLEELI